VETVKKDEYVECSECAWIFKNLDTDSIEETEVPCEDCGDHSAVRCPHCNEKVDMVYGFKELGMNVLLGEAQGKHISKGNMKRYLLQQKCSKHGEVLFKECRQYEYACPKCMKEADFDLRFYGNTEVKVIVMPPQSVDSIVTEIKL